MKNLKQAGMSSNDLLILMYTLACRLKKKIEHRQFALKMSVPVSSISRNTTQYENSILYKFSHSVEYLNFIINFFLYEHIS